MLEKGDIKEGATTLGVMGGAKLYTAAALIPVTPLVDQAMHYLPHHVDKVILTSVMLAALRQSQARKDSLLATGRSTSMIDTPFFNGLTRLPIVKDYFTNRRDKAAEIAVATSTVVGTMIPAVLASGFVDRLADHFPIIQSHITSIEAGVAIGLVGLGGGMYDVWNARRSKPADESESWDTYDPGWKTTLSVSV